MAVRQAFPYVRLISSLISTGESPAPANMSLNERRLTRFRSSPAFSTEKQRELRFPCSSIIPLGIEVCAYTRSIGPVSIHPDTFDREAITQTATGMPDKKASADAEAFLETCIKNQDSSGGVIECCVTGLPAGIGDPVFDKLDARLASAIMSIGAVKAVEIGDGIEVSSRKGSENNDAFCIKDGQVSKKTNHAGGILGGISDGSPVLLRAHIKPTPSIFQPQQTIGRDHVERTLQIKGRHDPVIVPRAVVVVESMTALTILDLMLSNMGARMDHLEKIYTK